MNKTNIEQEIQKSLVKTLENNHDFSDSMVNHFKDSGEMREKAVRYIGKHTDINLDDLTKEEQNSTIEEYIEVISTRLKEVLQKEDEVLELFDTESPLHEYTKEVNKKLIDEVLHPVDALIEYHVNSNHPDKVIALRTALKYLELEDKDKVSTLTDEQYKQYLETGIIHITTKQFTSLYNMTADKQKRLRGRRNDKLPHYSINNKILYRKEEVDEWIENYKKIRANKVID